MQVLGAGPAGASAAIAASQYGIAVGLREKSRGPKHKVCGEFLSPEIVPALERLGVWPEFQAARPAHVRRMGLCFGERQKWTPLCEPAFGLSRYRFDQLLRRRVESSSAGGRPVILARGRTGAAPKGSRLFGFKAHFTGPAADAVELYFFDGCYVGLNSVEDGITNVCGIAPESRLVRYGFEVDGLLAASVPLKRRIAPLARSMDWLHTGPLIFHQDFLCEPDMYPAGDALSFVDPFTGTGIAAAVLTGELAGRCAAQGVPVESYLREARRMLGSAFRVSSLFRSALRTRIGEFLAPFVPAQLLFRLTRPSP